MDFDSLLGMCSNDQLDRITEECHLFKEGLYEDKETLIKAIRNIIYEQ